MLYTGRWYSLVVCMPRVLSECPLNDLDMVYVVYRVISLVVCMPRVLAECPLNDLYMVYVVYRVMV